MRLEQLIRKPERVVAGVMSGTSVDGVDAVIARLSGTGPGLEISLLGHAFAEYDPSIRERILANSTNSGNSTEDISQLNAALPKVFSVAIRGAIEAANLELHDLDLVGSHGQTIHHVPVPKSIGSMKARSTLQIGDPSVLANLVQTPVVGDFRTADMALGGQGAPLVPYLDFVMFRDPNETRVLLNLGGIANITVLRPECDAADIVAFDTGPANMVVDALAERHFGQPYDDGGALAAETDVDESLLRELLRDEYYSRKPPKSTGRERFGTQFVSELCASFGKALGPEATWSQANRRKLLATATALTARTVSDGAKPFLTDLSSTRVIVSGGGTKNSTLMSMLSEELDPATVEPIDAYGVGSTEKEALCFAVLAHELVNETATGLPSVTGASKPAMQGKICLPS